MSETRIFVFGSNEAGRHGKGAAKFALDHRGAVYGQGYGLHGQSYAIPTKDKRIQTLSLEEIQKYVCIFRAFAFEHPELRFELTPIGCGLAGYTPEQIAPMFANTPDNVDLPEEFKKVLQK